MHSTCTGTVHMPSAHHAWCTCLVHMPGAHAWCTCLVRAVYVVYTCTVHRYVYIAETDHLLRRDLPNRATPQLNVAFFFPYMSPRDAKCGAVAKKWFDGNINDIPPVGPSPALMHVDVLRRLTPEWSEPAPT